MDTNGTPWEGELYETSRYNFIPEVRDQYNFREPVFIQDFTIVKMDHLEGTRLYSVEEYQEIARQLDEIGIPETVFLTDQYTGAPKETRVWEGVRGVTKLGLKIKVRTWGHFGTWAPGEYKSRIDKMADYGADSIGLSASLPKVLAQAKGNGAAEEPVDELPDAIDYAKKKGLPVCVGFVYVGGPEDFPTAIARQNHYIDLGAESLLMSDSKGIATPDATRYFVSQIRAGLKKDIPIFYHVHDCFGTATAQSLAATSAGACPQVTVNGLADMGFASLEEVVVSLELQYGIRTGVDLRKLPELSHTIERITGIVNPPYKAITGPLQTASGLPDTYIGMVNGKSFKDLGVKTPYEPELVGARPNLLMTNLGLSTRAVEAKLKQMGLRSDSAAVQKAYEALLVQLEALGNKFPVMLNDAEVEAVCRGAVG